MQGETHSLFELSLDTGKKNQIRAHLSSKGYPLAGDENYRARTDPFFRLALHARTLEFLHPSTGKKMKFEVPEPAEWAEYVRKGDPHPRKPVCAASVPHGSRSGKSDKPVFMPKQVSRKDMRKMDFISRGKNAR